MVESQEIFSKLFQKAAPEGKKIVAARIENSIRTALQRTFVPLLIEIFEARQAIDILHMRKNEPELAAFEKIARTPEEIIERLVEIRENIEETLRWGEGLQRQVQKTLEEAKDLCPPPQ